MSEDDEYYKRTLELLEKPYLEADACGDVAGGSGSGGGLERWERKRRVLVGAFEHDGSWLDVGCANGLLMETLTAWACEKRLRVEPYGLELSPRIAEVARQRLPLWADRIWTGNVKEPRDAMYRIARFLIEEWWVDEAKLVDALSVVLLTWNSAFYRYGAFDSGVLEACIRAKRPVIEGFRKRNISSLVQADHAVADELFKSVSKALARVEEKQLETPVGCVKALHLLAPNFFPLWDQYIAPAYHCPYKDELFPHIAYRVFCDRTREIAASVESGIANAPDQTKSWLMSKPLLKRIDEYNYVTFTLPELQKEREKRKQKAKKSAAPGT